MRTIAPSSPARRRAGAELRPRWLAPFALSLCLSLVAACATGRGTIGAVIAQDSDSGRLFLRDVPPSLAAGQANLKPGDEILLIDGLDVRRLDPEQINALLTGDVDSPVKLTVIRQEQVLRVTLRRTEAHRLGKKPGKTPQSAR